MPRGKKGTYALAEDGNGGLAPVRVDGGSDSVSSVSAVPLGETRTAEASIAFRQLLARTDGWLRCIPGGDGNVSYWKWKYAQGQHKGKYVMYVAGPCDWAGGVLGVAQKVDEVDEGTRRPAHDTFYDPR